MNSKRGAKGAKRWGQDFKRLLKKRRRRGWPNP
jgi:hypothetical protein